jgi:hypothetical protein
MEAAYGGDFPAALGPPPPPPHAAHLGLLALSPPPLDGGGKGVAFSISEGPFFPPLAHPPPAPPMMMPPPQPYLLSIAADGWGTAVWEREGGVRRGDEEGEGEGMGQGQGAGAGERGGGGARPPVEMGDDDLALSLVELRKGFGARRAMA